MYRLITTVIWIALLIVPSYIIQAMKISIGAPYDCSNLSSDSCIYERAPTGIAYDSLHAYETLASPTGFDTDSLCERDREFFNSKSADYWQASGQETTLRQVLLIHRHGDRTPISFAPEDKLANEPFWTFHGLGQLTNRGKARLFMLGKIMRMRYDKFLGKSSNKNIRKSRASGSLRCIESAQVFLASLLSLNASDSIDARNLSWDKVSNNLAHFWQPASITTLSSKIDGLLNEGATCNILDREYRLINEMPEYKEIEKEFELESQLLKKILNFETDSFYKWFWASSFLEVELSYMPNKVDSRLRQAFKRIEEAGNRALVLYQSTLLSKRLRAGLLVNDIINNMMSLRKSAQNNSPLDPYSRKLVHYSAHDLNLIVLLGMFDNISKYPFRPDYAANIVIELHQDKDDWFIKFFYMSHVPKEIVELDLHRCSDGHPRNRCTLDNFNTTMQQYNIGSWQTWMRECQNDLSSVDPYAQNA